MSFLLRLCPTAGWPTAVANGRGLSVEQVRSLATGEVWIGETAVAAGLVDGIGTLDDAVVALANEILANEVNATAQPNRMTNMSQKDGKKMSEEILESRVAELQAELEAERIARETAVAQVAELEHEARFQRFEKLIGMGESAWAGERGVHLQMLTVLADAKGEGSDEFVAYVQQQKGLTAQLVDSVLFAEMGSGQRDGNGDAAGKLEAQANMLAQEKGLTYEQAYALVLEGNPALYAAYQKEGV